MRQLKHEAKLQVMQIMELMVLMLILIILIVTQEVIIVPNCSFGVPIFVIATEQFIRPSQGLQLSQANFTQVFKAMMLTIYAQCAITCDLIVYFQAQISVRQVIGIWYLLIGASLCEFIHFFRVNQWFQLNSEVFLMVSQLFIIL